MRGLPWKPSNGRKMNERILYDEDNDNSDIENNNQVMKPKTSKGQKGDNFVFLREQKMFAGYIISIEKIRNEMY